MINLSLFPAADRSLGGAAPSTTAAPVVVVRGPGHDDVVAPQHAQGCRSLVAYRERQVAHEDVALAVVELLVRPEVDRSAAGKDTRAVRRRRLLDGDDLDRLQEQVVL